MDVISDSLSLMTLKLSSETESNGSPTTVQHGRVSKIKPVTRSHSSDRLSVETFDKSGQFYWCPSRSFDDGNLV
jgi:hypothetical protein